MHTRSSLGDMHVDSNLFDGLDAAGILEVLDSMQHRHFEAGDVLCHAGEAGESLFLILHGLVHVLAADARDDHATNAAPAVLSRLRARNVVGEMALLTGEPRSATLVSRVPTDVLELRREAFARLAQHYPVLLANLGRIVSQRLVALNAGISRTHKAEAVAVLFGEAGLPSAADLVVATQAASRHPVAAIDLVHTGAESERDVGAILQRLDAALRDHRVVMLLLRADDPDLLVLLDHMDRVVALLGPGEIRQHAARLDAVPGRHELFAPGFTDLAWLGRHLARTKVGLALGAGGAKGFAHVGVLRTLAQAGYPVDYVAGSSIGAWVGAWLACGMDADTIDRTLRTAFTAEVVGVLFRHTAGPRAASERMAQLARDTTDERDFRDVSTPLVIMAADLMARQPLPIATGPLHEALLAAMAVPGLYAPVVRGAHRLVDAVALTPVPTEVVRAAGADITIAVNLLGRETLPIWPGIDPPDPFRGRSGAAERDTVVEVLELAQLDAAARETNRADIPITPRFGPGTWRHFQLADYFLDAGTAATEAVLPALSELALPQPARAAHSATSGLAYS
jgi:NTE family protein